MRLWSVEGNSQRLDGGSMYGNVPRALWQRWTKPDADNLIEFSCRGILARNLNGRTVLFETGIGTFFEPLLRERYGVRENEHVLLQSLRALGLGHEDVDVVVLSHLHFDHAGGLLAPYRPDRPLELLFPKARFLVSRQAWERARAPHPRDRASFIPGLTELLERSGRLEIVDAERSAVLGDAVRFELTEGHTPGLLHAEIGGDGGVVFCSDLIPGRPWVHLPVTMGYDRYPERLIDEKRRFLDDKIARGVRLFFTHDLGCALAAATVDAAGKFGVTDERAVVEALELGEGRSSAG
jgi:glyoxylase-like metal-dependent hydrolase (beta-lactamase superfamily II)